MKEQEESRMTAVLVPFASNAPSIWVNLHCVFSGGDVDP
jgi:hypothetical protein